MDQEQISNLIQRYYNGEATEAQKESLLFLVRDPENEQLIKEELERLLKTGAVVKMDDTTANEIVQAILAVPGRGKARVVRFGLGKWAVAAAIILMVAVGGWWWIERKPEGGGSKTEVAKTNDVPAPSNTRAVITLADGSKVYLDSAENGILANEENVSVTKNENGEISYTAGPVNLGPNDVQPVTFNTLSNPRGSKVITLRLSDGTQIWLNAESSLKYPTAFTGTTREVEITGEAYFEVRHDSKQPFRVHLPDGGIVEDIGTSFNINSYGDENDIRTTLIEGSARVYSGPLNQNIAKSKIIKAGQQAVLNPATHSLVTINSVDLESTVAWKNGKFAFGESTGLDVIMRQLARWYDVEVVYEDKVQQQFGGNISRHSNISQVLEKLQLTGKVHFKIDGRKITVSK